MPKECPECELLSPESTMRCDCGFAFKKGKAKRSYVPPSMRIKAISMSFNWAIIFISVLILSRILFPYVGDSILPFMKLLISSDSP